MSGMDVGIIILVGALAVFSIYFNLVVSRKLKDEQNNDNNKKIG